MGLANRIGGGLGAISGVLGALGPGLTLSAGLAAVGGALTAIDAEAPDALMALGFRRPWDDGAPLYGIRAPGWAHYRTMWRWRNGRAQTVAVGAIVSDLDALFAHDGNVRGYGASFRRLHDLTVHLNKGGTIADFTTYRHSTNDEMGMLLNLEAERRGGTSRLRGGRLRWRTDNPLHSSVTDIQPGGTAFTWTVPGKLKVWKVAQLLTAWRNNLQAWGTRDPEWEDIDLRTWSGGGERDAYHEGTKRPQWEARRSANLVRYQVRREQWFARRKDAEREAIRQEALAAINATVEAQLQQVFAGFNTAAADLAQAIIPDAERTIGQADADELSILTGFTNQLAQSFGPSTSSGDQRNKATVRQDSGGMGALIGLAVALLLIGAR